MTVEIKTVAGMFRPEFKTAHLPSGVEVGVVPGLLATWDIDEVMDRFVRGAFKKSIAEHKSRDNRQIRLSDEHRGLIGGFPIDKVFETDKGLEVEANVNLQHSQGRDVWALIEQRVIVDFSIGFSAKEFTIDDGIRSITEAPIWHGSTTGEPMNRNAQIGQIKSLHGMPIAAEGYEWDAVGAVERLEEMKRDPGALMIGSRSVCDVIGGIVTIIPQALAEAVKGVDDPEMIRTVEQLYAQMKKSSPFDRSARQYWSRSEVDSITRRELEAVLVGHMSKSSAKSMVSRFEGLDTETKTSDDSGSETVAEILRDLRAVNGQS